MKNWLISSALIVCVAAARGEDVSAWKKGALHAHTLWSDGRSLPEVALQTYKDLGYDFVCLSDHNVFQLDPAVWMQVSPEEGGWPPAMSGAEFARSLQMLPGGIDEKAVAFRNYVRLKTYPELKAQFEEPGKFLVVGGEEITMMAIPFADGGRRDIHMNTFNIEEYLPPMVGKDGADTIRINLEQYQAAARRGGKPSFLMLNHPFWKVWDVDPRDLIANPEVQIFEICNNGSTDTVPEGLYSAEQFWDIVLAHRIEDGTGTLYGTGTDDAHYYDPARLDGDAGCDNAWVMVDASQGFSADAVAEAISHGKFYASCGVSLDEIDFSADDATLRVKAKALEGVNYKIQFITTKRGFDRSVVEKDFSNGNPALFRRLPTFSAEIGQVAKEVAAGEAAYTLAPDDLYVRAIVISDRPTTIRETFFPETERAWTQPFVNPNINKQL